MGRKEKLVAGSEARAEGGLRRSRGYAGEAA